MLLLNNLDLKFANILSILIFIIYFYCYIILINKTLI